MSLANLKSHFQIPWVPFLIITLGTAFVFYSGLFTGFFIIDDAQTYFLNTPMKNFDVYRLFFDTSIEFSPLTFMSFAIEHSLFGENPFILHLTNLFLHILNIYLVGRLCQCLIPDQPKLVLFVMAIFAIHPLNVEAVVWISSRKDLLSCSLALLALITYWKTPPWGKGRLKYLAFIAIFSILAMLAKGAAVTLVALLFFLDLWRKRPLDKKFIGEISMVIVAAIYVAYRQIRSHGSFSKVRRMSQWALDESHDVGASITFYLSKFVLPTRLSVYYESFAFETTWIDLLIVFAFFSSLIFVFWKYPKQRYAMSLGLIAFVAAISPYLKIIPFGRNFLVADRYFYFAGIFLIILSVRLVWNLPKKQWILVSFVSFYSGLSFSRVQEWTNERGMINDILIKYPKSAYPHQIRAIFAEQDQDIDKAILEYQTALDKAGDKENYLYNLGTLYMQKGQCRKAIEIFDRAENSWLPSLANNRANCYRILGDHDKAKELFLKRIEYRPNEFTSYQNMAVYYLEDKEPDKAIEMLKHVIRIESHWYGGYRMMAKAYKMKGDLKKAEEYFKISRTKEREPRY